MGVLDNTLFFLPVLEAGKPKIKGLADLVRNHFLVCRWLWSCILTWWKAEGGGSQLSQAFLYKILILLIRALPSCPNPLSKAPPPNTSTQEIMLQHMNFTIDKYSVNNNVSKRYI